MFGRNLKVHFAGAEQIASYEAAMFAGVRYQLFTVFPFICKSFGLTGFPAIGIKDENDKIRMIKENIQNQSHTIMDSGLFTLMFGAHAGKRDEAFIRKWTEELANFVNTNSIKATCVETDCQKVLGVEQAWKMRYRLAELLPNNRIINVFHIEDGKSGLDRLIEYSNYIAVSVPELRIVYGHGKKHENAVIRLADYIKNKKPQIDIHLLGCTAKTLLEKCNFCTSSDSTSWTSISRYGTVRKKDKIFHVSQINQQKRDEIQEQIKQRLNRRGIVSSRYDTYANLVITCKCLLADYTRYAGDQT